MSGFKNTTIFIDAKAKNTNITNMNLEGYENTKLIVNANNCNINIPLVNVENIIEDTTLITINGNYNNITIENITSKSDVTDVYDVVGPICESSDCFGQDETLPLTKRGDLLALRSAGAYGEIMASQYNCRNLPGSFAK